MKFLPAFLALLAALQFTASAQTTELQINWGSDGDYQKMIFSDGTALVPGDFVVEIGTFLTGFIPTMANIDSWDANWLTFDAILPSDATTDPTGPDFFELDPGDPNQMRFQGSANLDENQNSDSTDANPAHVFPAGAQAYIWAYNQMDFLPGAEWALFTSAVDSDGSGPGTSDAVWSFPDTSLGQEGTTVTWQIDQADTAIVGAVGWAGSVTSGGGDVTDNSFDFVLRTHGVAGIPEASVALLAGFAGLFLLGRRQR